MLSSRANSFLSYESDYGVHQVKNYNNIFDENGNESGAICMSIAENNLCRDMIIQKIRQSNLFFSENVCNYTSSTGLPEFKKCIRDFAVKYVWKECNISLDEIICSSGCVSLLHQLAFLLFEKGDAIIIPTPYYPAFVHDFKNIGGVQILDSSDITETALSEAYFRGLASNTSVKALLLCNPCNPTGRVYTTAELEICYSFCQCNNMHLIIDEVYALSCFEADTFTSFATWLSARTKRNYNGENVGSECEDVNKLRCGFSLGTDMVHILYSLSKDMGGSGFRVGVLYSNNTKLLQACGGMNDVSMISNIAQQALIPVLSDDFWVNAYLSENRSRLRACYNAITHGLVALGVEVLPAGSGIFAFINLRKLFLKDLSTDEKCLDRNNASGFYGQEIELENRLRMKLLFFTPGRACHHAEPGWFRMCYAWTSLSAVHEAIRRITVLFQENELRLRAA